MRRLLYALPPLVLLLALLGAWLLRAPEPEPRADAARQRAALEAWLGGLDPEAIAPLPATVADLPSLHVTLFHPPYPPNRLHLDDPDDARRRETWRAALEQSIRDARRRNVYEISLKLSWPITHPAPYPLDSPWRFYLQYQAGKDAFVLGSGDSPPRFVLPMEPAESGIRPDRVLDKTLGSPPLGARLRRFRTEALVRELDEGVMQAVQFNQPIDPRPPTRASARAAIVEGADFLLRHQSPQGRFEYLHDPVELRPVRGYNALRHAGTTFALFQVYGLTGERRFLEAGERALAWIEQQYLRERGDMAFLVRRDEVKLGGAALTLLALTERERQVDDDRDLGTMRALGRFIEQQMEPDGFLHSYYDPGGGTAEERVSIYYPGEATFALVRLARVTGEARWRELAIRAADHLIGRARWFGFDLVVFPDAWLTYALADLYEDTGERRFLDYALTIVERMVAAQYRGENDPFFDGGFLDPRFPRTTPAAARAEALGALLHALRRRGHERLAEGYREHFLAALGFVLRHQVGPANDYQFREAGEARGGFVGSAIDLRMRIDYTQHSLSALVQALDWLPPEQQVARSVESR